MAGAIWCVVEDDRKGLPKKVMAEVLGEATRLGGPTEAVRPHVHGKVITRPRRAPVSS